MLGFEQIYEEEHAESVAAAVMNLLRPGGTAIFIASIEPARPGWPKFRQVLYDFSTSDGRFERTAVQLPQSAGVEAASEVMPSCIWSGLASEERHEMVAWVRTGLLANADNIDAIVVDPRPTDHRKT